jgi:hypothetical protein
MDVDKELWVIRKALKEDPDYYYCWQSNIAGAFYDGCIKEMGFKDQEGSRQFLLQKFHDIANQAAKRFLDQLIGNIEEDRG